LSLIVLFNSRFFNLEKYLQKEIEKEVKSNKRWQGVWDKFKSIKRKKLDDFDDKKNIQKTKC